jgi:hypothetical protein
MVHEVDTLDPLHERTMIYAPTRENGKSLLASHGGFFPPSVRNHITNLPDHLPPKFWSLHGLKVNDEQDTDTGGSSANATGVSVDLVFNRPGYVFDCFVEQFSTLSAVIL